MPQMQACRIVTGSCDSVNYSFLCVKVILLEESFVGIWKVDLEHSVSVGTMITSYLSIAFFLDNKGYVTRTLCTLKWHYF